LRLILILVTALVAVALGAVLSLPYLLDALPTRELIVGRLQQASGRKVMVQGDAEIRLFPRPRVSLGQVTIGSAIGGEPAFLMQIDRLDADLGFLGLFGAGADIRSVRLIRPTVEIRPGALDGGPTLPAPLLAEAGRLDRLVIVDGTIAFQGAAAGVPASIQGIELDLKLRPEGRGADLAARASIEGQGLAIEATTGPLAADAPTSVDARLAYGEDAARATMAFQGTARLGPEGGRVAGAALDGELKIAAGSRAPLRRLADLAGMTLPPALARLDAPLDLAARLERSPGHLALADLVLGLGGQQLTGASTFDGTGEPRLDLTLAATELTLPRALVEAAPDLLAALAPPADLAGRVELRVAALHWRGRQLRDARLALAMDGKGAIAVERLSAVLPDDGDLHFTGRLAGLPDAPVLTGPLSAATQDLRGLLVWLGAPEARLPPGRPQAFSLTGEIELKPEAVTLRRAEIRLDASRATGSLALVGGARDRLAAALTIDRLILDPYLPGPPTPADLAALAPAGLDAAVDLTVNGLGWQDARADHVHLRADLEAGEIRLTELAFDGLAEASGNIVGTARPAAGTFDLAIDATAPRPSRLLRLLGIEPPPVLIRFQPAKLGATLRGDAKGSDIELEVGLPGLDLTLEGHQPSLLSLAGARLEATAKSPSLPALLRQLGAPLLAETGLTGPVDLEAALDATDPARATGRIEATLGQSHLQSTLAVATDGEVPRVTGEVDAGTLRLELLETALDLAAAPLGLGLPSDWIGSWPGLPLSWRWLYAGDLDLALAADRVASGGASLGGAALHARLESGTLSIDRLDLPLAGGRLTGKLRVDGEGDRPVLGSTVRLAGGRAEQVMALLGPPTGLAGRLDLDLDLGGVGADPRTIVRNLAGGLSFDLTDGTLDGIQLAAAPDPLAGQRTDFGRLTGSATVKSGIATAAPEGLALHFPGGDATIQGRFDLLAWILEGRIEARFDGRPDLPPLRLDFIGPPGRVQLRAPSAPKPVSPTGPASSPAAPTP
jgi:hypothetical protein